MNRINAEEWIDKIIADYKIVLEVGRGDTGVVFLGEHTTQKHYAAVKIFPPGDVAETALKSAKFLQRLSHHAVATVYDCGKFDGFVFIISEYISYKKELNDDSFSTGKLFSKNLNEFVEMQSGLVAEKTVIEIMSQIIDALEFLFGLKNSFETSIPYGGIHPNRILVTETHGGFIKIKLTDVGVPVVRSGNADVDTFLSPEEIQGKPANEKSHVYSLGAIAYLLITGTAPPSPVIPPTQIRGDISAGWNEIIKNALAFEPEERYSDCQALRRALLHVKSLIPKKVTFNALKAALVTFVIFIALILIYALIYKNTGISKKVEEVVNKVYEPEYKDIITKKVAETIKKEPVIKPEKHPILNNLENKQNSTNINEEILDMEKSVAVIDSSEKNLPGSVIDNAVKTVKPKITTKKQPKDNAIKYEIYTVQKNDSLWGIAWQHYMTIKELLFINDLSDDVIIKAGQKLKVKKGKTRPLPKPKKKKATNTVAKVNTKVKTTDEKTDKISYIEYTVNKGDTYYSLSKKFGVSVNELEKLNANKKLITGMKIKVKKQ